MPPKEGWVTQPQLKRRDTRPQPRRIEQLPLSSEVILALIIYQKTTRQERRGYLPRATYEGLLTTGYLRGLLTTGYLRRALHFLPRREGTINPCARETASTYFPHIKPRFGAARYYLVEKNLVTTATGEDQLQRKMGLLIFILRGKRLLTLQAK